MRRARQASPGEQRDGVSAVPRLAVRVATALLLAAAFVAAGGTAGAAADAALVSAVPADGAVLPRAPRYVKLTFDRSPDLAQSHVGVADGSSTLLDIGELTAPGPRTVRQQIRAAGAGTSVVAYHMVFNDGTEATGTIRFSVGTGTPPQTGSSDAQQAAEAAVLGGHHHGGVDPLSAVMLVVDLGVLLGAVSLLVLRPRGGEPDADDGHIRTDAR